MSEPASHVAPTPPSSAWVLRGLVLLVALAAVGWLAGSLRALDLTAQATAGGNARGAARPSPATLKVAFDRARRFNDDVSVLLPEAAGLAIGGDRQGALAAATAATRKEPANFAAWALLYGLQRGGDPVDAAAARRRALRLDPQARAAFSR